MAQNWATPILATGSATAEVYVRASGSATADASVMAPSPFAVKLSVGAVGAVEAVEAVGGGGALSQEEDEVVWAGRGACPHASHALPRGDAPATA